MVLMESAQKLTTNDGMPPFSLPGTNPNNHPDYPLDEYKHMKEFLMENGVRFPHLFDEIRPIACIYGVVCTADTFVFDASLRRRYHERIDDMMSLGAPAGGHDLAVVAEDILTVLADCYCKVVF